MQRALLNECQSTGDLLEGDLNENQTNSGNLILDQRTSSNIQEYLQVEESSIHEESASSTSWANKRLKLMDHLDDKEMQMDSRSPSTPEINQDDSGCLQSSRHVGTSEIGRLSQLVEEGLMTPQDNYSDDNEGQKTGGGDYTDIVKLQSDLPESSGAHYYYQHSQNQSMVKMTDSMSIAQSSSKQQQSPPSESPAKKLIKKKGQEQEEYGHGGFESIENEKVMEKQTQYNLLPQEEKALCLQEQFSKLYLYLRQRIKSSGRVSFENFKNISMMQSEDRLVFEMDTFLIIEYIKAAIGVILEIKFEEIERKLNEQQDGDPVDLNESKQSLYKSQNGCGKQDDSESVTSSVKREKVMDGIFSPRGPSLEDVKQIKTERGRTKTALTDGEASKCRSSIDTTDVVPSCPDLYEKLIQDLEADVRKHIRIQQQLKLHIESVEDRVEELEIENEQLISEYQKQQKKFKRSISDLEKVIVSLKDEKSQQADQIKTNLDQKSKLEKRIEDTEDELKKLKLSVQVQNLQENSFTLNRSIDQGEKFLQSIKKQEYSQFLKSTKVTHTESSCNSRSGKFSTQYQQLQQQQQQQQQLLDSTSERRPETSFKKTSSSMAQSQQKQLKKPNSIKQSNSTKASLLNHNNSSQTGRPVSNRNQITKIDNSRDLHALGKLSSSLTANHGGQVAHQSLVSSTNNINNNKDAYQMKIISSNAAKVLSPRSIGKLHQNLHSQQAYGRKSPLVAKNQISLMSSQMLNKQQQQQQSLEQPLRQPIRESKSKDSSLKHHPLHDSQDSGSKQRTTIAITSQLVGGVVHTHNKNHGFNTGGLNTSAQNSLTRESKERQGVTGGHHKVIQQQQLIKGAGNQLKNNVQHFKSMHTTQKTKSNMIKKGGSQNPIDISETVKSNNNLLNNCQAQTVLRNPWINNSKGLSKSTIKKSNHSIASFNSNQNLASQANNNNLMTNSNAMTQQSLLSKHQQSLNSSVISNQTKQYSATKQIRSSNQKTNGLQQQSSTISQITQPQSATLLNQQYQAALHDSSLPNNHPLNMVNFAPSQAQSSGQNPTAAAAGATQAASATNGAPATTVMVNVGNLGYPSIINNNIQGLSINYSSHHIIQQQSSSTSQPHGSGASATDNNNNNNYASHQPSGLGLQQQIYQQQAYNQGQNIGSSNLQDQTNHLSNGQNVPQQTSALSSHRRCRSQSPRNGGGDGAGGEPDQNSHINNSMICPNTKLIGTNLLQEQEAPHRQQYDASQVFHQTRTNNNATNKQQLLYNNDKHHNTTTTTTGQYRSGNFPQNLHHHQQQTERHEPLQNSMCGGGTSKMIKAHHTHQHQSSSHQSRGNNSRSNRQKNITHQQKSSSSTSRTKAVLNNNTNNQRQLLSSVSGSQRNNFVENQGHNSQQRQMMMMQQQTQINFNSSQQAATSATDKKTRSDSSLSNTKNAIAFSTVHQQLYQPQQSSHVQSSARKQHHDIDTTTTRVTKSTFKRKPTSKKQLQTKKISGYGQLNSHSVEQPIANNDSSVSSLMQKIMTGTAGTSGAQISKQLKSSSRDPQSNLVSQRSRNYKFKVGSTNMGANSSLTGSSNIIMNHNMTTTGGMGISHNNYRTTNTSNSLGGANFGLGGLASLANFGSYLGSGAGGNNVKSHGSNLNTSGGGSASLIHHQQHNNNNSTIMNHIGNNNNMSSAYATNASDLIRGFKSSQSIPVVTSQQASVRQMSRQSRDSSQQNTDSKQQLHQSGATMGTQVMNQVLPHKNLKAHVISNKK